MPEFIRQLTDDPNGCILIAQIARAARHRPPGLNRELRDKRIARFVSEIGAQLAANGVRKTKDMINIDESFAFPILRDRSGDFFHLDQTEMEIDPDEQLVHVTTWDTFRDYIAGPEMFEAIPEEGVPDLVASLSGAAFDPATRIGLNPKRNQDLLWATVLKDVLSVVPSAAEKGPMSRADASRLRDFLGLGQRGPETALVLLVFRAGAMATHVADPDTKVTRPFLFEGVGNQRFHLFDYEDGHGWNHAVDLEGIPYAQLRQGAREAVMTSISAAEIERCVLTERPSTPPCVRREEEVLAAMLGGASLEDAVGVITRLTEPGAGGA